MTTRIKIESIKQADGNRLKFIKVSEEYLINEEELKSIYKILGEKTNGQNKN